MVAPVLSHQFREREGQRTQAFSTDGRDGEHRPPLGLEIGTHHLRQLRGLGHVDLVQHHDAGPVRQITQARVTRQRRHVRRQLGLERLHVGYRVTTRIEGGAVDHVGQHGAPLEVTQEVETEPLALARTGNETGHVGNGERGLTARDDPEVRHQRRERVVGDLRLSRRQHRHERRLSRAGEPDQADVRDGLQLENQIAFLAVLAEQGEAGRLAGARGESGVPEATATAGRRLEPGALPDQVGENPAVLVQHDRAVGNAQDQVLADGAVTVAAGTLCSVAALRVRMEVEVEQSVDAGVDDQDDVAAVPAVTAVGAAEGLELLPMHGRASVAALSCTDVQSDAVDEARHGRGPSERVTRVVTSGETPTGAAGEHKPSEPPLPGTCRSAGSVPPAVPQEDQTSAAAGTMLTVLRPRLVPNRTAPAARAKSVSSPPRPTFTPG